ncbi:hypothetical protein MPSEU_000888200 [Mayamaea pseudoterrestris]|nr:hypothetical protein MPSEU_000888200 [Mayamaea pseudoterrestris]
MRIPSAFRRMALDVSLLLLLPSAATMSIASNDINLRSACACGKVSLSIQYRSSSAASQIESASHSSQCLDCHCPDCRKYHDSAFVSYLKMDQSCIKVNDQSSRTTDDIVSYSDSCRQFGPSERISCRRCSSKLFTRLRPQENQETLSTSDQPLNSPPGDVLVNLGCVQDESIPKELALAWRTSRLQYQENYKAPWLDARPGKGGDISAAIQSTNGPRYLTGSCACQRHSYRIRLDEDAAQMAAPFSTELQHCYCKLCRQLSGGPFMTWIPVEEENFEWIRSGINDRDTSESFSLEPPLIRTTSHGQRHICQTCRSVMTIVYDEQPDVVWPVAASLHDDASEPSDRRNRELLREQCNYDRVLHICCRYKQPWYQLPSDGLERVQEAC